MPEWGPLGSVRGALSNERPYRDGELLKLGFEVAQSSVAKYMVKRCGPPSQGWRLFRERQLSILNRRRGPSMNAFLHRKDLL